MDISKNTSHIKQLVETLRKDKKLKKGLEKAQVKKLWTELMGKSIEKYTSNVTYKQGVLTVYLTSSALREELSRGKDKIINLMNEHYGKKVINKVILK